MIQITITQQLLDEIVITANKYGALGVVVTGIEIVSFSNATSSGDGFVLLTGQALSSAGSSR